MVGLACISKCVLCVKRREKNKDGGGKKGKPRENLGVAEHASVTDSLGMQNVQPYMNRREFRTAC